ncbi:hypothetical protein GCM10025867_04470 [Frondihabitans sucicola]|uniref:Polymer-forming cytoskeletal protein n=1 Tax=Frondihabitans sucicola TaxID=1268041 RepID=A0ABM8GJ59_9MICO|nr:hypothetical protein [Frondihabitans sucicola]BDZ48206.1 hypothetical protein GCM10025867_04470 [Frondihabitans sucicola]
MKKLSGALSHPLVVEEPTVLTGTAQRGVVVCEGGSLDLRGVVADRLTIEPGGYVLLSGTCTARISVHEGGLLEIAGTLDGSVSTNDGEIWAMAGSVIHGRALSSAGFFVPPSPETTVVTESPRFRLTGTGELLDIVT